MDRKAAGNKQMTAQLRGKVRLESEVLDDNSLLKAAPLSCDYENEGVKGGDEGSGSSLLGVVKVGDYERWWLC